MGTILWLYGSRYFHFHRCLCFDVHSKVTIGVRVDEEEELRGLDVSEHGMEAYSEPIEQPQFDLAIK